MVTITWVYVLLAFVLTVNAVAAFDCHCQTSGAATQSYASLSSAHPSRLSACRPARAFPCSSMFVVTEAEAAAIRAVYEQRGEFSAAVELRRRFPGMTDNAQARE